VDSRPDVLTWKTEPLKEDVTVAGNVVAKLFASTTGIAADWNRDPDRCVSGKKKWKNIGSCLDSN